MGGCAPRGTWCLSHTTGLCNPSGAEEPNHIPREPPCPNRPKARGTPGTPTHAVRHTSLPWGTQPHPTGAQHPKAREVAEGAPAHPALRGPHRTHPMGKAPGVASPLPHPPHRGSPLGQEARETPDTNPPVAINKTNRPEAGKKPPGRSPPGDRGALAPCNSPKPSGGGARHSTHRSGSPARCSSASCWLRSASSPGRSAASCSPRCRRPPRGRRVR